MKARIGRPPSKHNLFRNDLLWCDCFGTFLEPRKYPGLGYRCLKRHCPGEPTLEVAQRLQGIRPRSWPAEPRGATRTPIGGRVLLIDDVERPAPFGEYSLRGRIDLGGVGSGRRPAKVTLPKVAALQDE